MKSFTEFKTRIESDKAFAAKFVGVENESQIIALAKAEGYDLEQLSENELEAVSGGNVINDIKKFWDWITTK